MRFAHLIASLPWLSKRLSRFSMHSSYVTARELHQHRQLPSTFVSSAFHLCSSSSCACSDQWWSVQAAVNSGKTHLSTVKWIKVDRYRENSKECRFNSQRRNYIRFKMKPNQLPKKTWFGYEQLEQNQRKHVHVTHELTCECTLCTSVKQGFIPTGESSCPRGAETIKVCEGSRWLCKAKQEILTPALDGL